MAVHKYKIPICNELHCCAVLFIMAAAESFTLDKGNVIALYLDFNVRHWWHKGMIYLSMFYFSSMNFLSALFLGWRKKLLKKTLPLRKFES